MATFAEPEIFSPCSIDGHPNRSHHLKKATPWALPGCARRPGRMNDIVVGLDLMEKAAFRFKGIPGRSAVLKTKVAVRIHINVQLIVHVNI